jgi:hypothetical protein
MERPLTAWHRGDAMQSNNVTLAVPLHHRSAWALSAGPMTKADRDAIGPDGTVRLRAYLTMANSLWLRVGPGSTNAVSVGGRWSDCCTIAVGGDHERSR